MFWSLNELRGYNLRERDGDIGLVHDFLFDDAAWKIRYLVANTGTWLPGRKVLVAPEAILRADWVGGWLDLNVTKEQIRNGPVLDAGIALSRPDERKLVDHHGWSPWWESPRAHLSESEASSARHGGGSLVAEMEAPPRCGVLRSVRDVTGYHIQAADGPIGHVEDFLTDDEDDWPIRFMVIGTRKWWPGRKVVIAPTWIEEIDWVTERVLVSKTREAIRHGFEYRPALTVRRETDTPGPDDDIMRFEH